MSAIWLSSAGCEGLFTRDLRGLTAARADGAASDVVDTGASSIAVAGDAVSAAVAVSTVIRSLTFVTPAVSFVTKGLVKSVRVFSRKPRVQSDSPDSSSGKISFHSSNQCTTDSVATRRVRCHKREDSPGRIVMLIGGMHKRADHPADAIIDDGNQGFVSRTRQNRL